MIYYPEMLLKVYNVWQLQVKTLKITTTAKQDN